ncbi:MAG TPA: hypothetical protein VEG64_16350 [Candidatus Sulfotelmatobacter sp.]|nr:hypothetical protein [Candidatus Sulfotelmatobacter sp.]
MSTANTPSTIVFTAVVYNSVNQAVTWAAMGGGSFVGNAFTAPTSPGNVTITATSQADSSKSASVTINVAAAQAITITPTAIALPAGESQQFTATVNGNVVAATWALAGAAGADLGLISATGMYTAPPSPPPHGSVSIVATFAGQGIATVTIVFSNASLNHQYTFAYSGQESGGFQAVAGTFTADGAGNILTGLEDVNSPMAVSTIQITGGTYSVGPDGRTQAQFVTKSGNVTFEMALVSNTQALIIRFDAMASGSGTAELANPAEFSNSAISGFYSFSVSGVDKNGVTEAIAGNFFSDAAGTFPLNSAIQDVNDGGTVTQADTTLFGNIVESVDPLTGRGTLSLTSTPAGTLNFAFYMVDGTHFKLVETDAAPILAGDGFKAPSSISALSLNGRFAFTLGGTMTLGPFAAGGVLISNGTGSITGGVEDVNQSAQSISLQQPIQSSSYSVNPTNSHRLSLTLNVANSSIEYGVYPAANGIAPMISLAATTAHSGLAFQQSSQNAPQGNFALNLTGFAGKGEQDINGAIATTGTTTLGGYLDLNDSGTLNPNLLLSGSTFTTTDVNGRGTITLETASPSPATLLLVYYAVDSSTVLVLEVDGARATVGMMANQF